MEILNNIKEDMRSITLIGITRSIGEGILYRLISIFGFWESIVDPMRFWRITKNTTSFVNAYMGEFKEIMYYKQSVEETQLTLVSAEKNRGLVFAYKTGLHVKRILLYDRSTKTVGIYEDNQQYYVPLAQSNLEDDMSDGHHAMSACTVFDRTPAETIILTHKRNIEMTAQLFIGLATTIAAIYVWVTSTVSLGLLPILIFYLQTIKNVFIGNG